MTLLRSALLAAAALAAACTSKASSEKPPPAQLAGLDAVPASARVVIGADPRRLAGSELVARAVQLMIAREPELGTRVAALADGCGLDWTKLASLHLAITDDAPQPMLVATGDLAEADLAKCVQSTVGAGGGSLSTEDADGRTLYRVVDNNRTVWFAFGRKDTVVLSASRDNVIAGLGTGKKALDAPEMKALIGRADTRAPLWAAGRVDQSLGQRMLRLTRGKVTTPPQAFLAKLDPQDGLTVELAAVMATEDDAKAMESQLIPTLQLISLAAQVRGLGPLAAKISGSRQGDVVRFGVSLTDAEVKEVLSKVDSRPPAEEDAGPASGD
jgi:hypothetical protein